jgi:hypothetical protein
MTKGDFNKFINFKPVSEGENAPMTGLKNVPGLTIASAYHIARSTM